MLETVCEAGYHSHMQPAREQWEQCLAKLRASTRPDAATIEEIIRALLGLPYPLDFCKEAGHTLCLVPSSRVVIPPDANVEQVRVRVRVNPNPRVRFRVDPNPNPNPNPNPKQFEWSQEELEVRSRHLTDTC